MGLFNKRPKETEYETYRRNEISSRKAPDIARASRRVDLLVAEVIRKANVPDTTVTQDFVRKQFHFLLAHQTRMWLGPYKVIPEYRLLQQEWIQLVRDHATSSPEELLAWFYSFDPVNMPEVADNSFREMIPALSESLIEAVTKTEPPGSRLWHWDSFLTEP